MLRINLTVLFVLLYSTIVLSQSGEKKIDVEAEKEAIKAVIKKEGKHLRDRNFDELSSTYAHEPYILWTGAGKGFHMEIAGWDSLETWIKQIFAVNPEPSKYVPIKENWNIRVYGDGAWVTFEEYGKSESEANPDLIPDRQFRMLEKTNQGWKIVFTGFINKESYKPKDLSTVIPIPSSGRIDRLANFPSKYITPRNVDIWLPEGYSEDEKYAVVYMHDGQWLFDPKCNNQEYDLMTDEVMGRLIGSDSVRKNIIVGIWNIDAERNSDYFPQKPFESLAQVFRDSILQTSSFGKKFLSGPAKSDNYLKFIVEELKPHVDSHYSTLSDRPNTFIVGQSMGGLISMYGICEYPKVFGAAACTSTHWPGIMTNDNNPIPRAFVDYMDSNLPEANSHRFYFDFGTENLDALYEEHQIQVDNVMRSKGYDSTNWITKKFAGEGHGPEPFSKRLHIPFTFLLGK